jgi:hypothetical protein
MIETLGIRRTACVNLDDGTISDPINLECGRIQGDATSQNKSNMAQQIPILKIELDPDIGSM